MKCEKCIFVECKDCKFADAEYAAVSKTKLLMYLADAQQAEAPTERDIGTVRIKKQHAYDLLEGLFNEIKGW